MPEKTGKVSSVLRSVIKSTRGLAARLTAPSPQKAAWKRVKKIPVTNELIKMERQFFKAMTEYDSPHLRALRSRKDEHPFDRLHVTLEGYATFHTALMTVVGISRLSSSRILEIGAGSGTYMDFLRTKYGFNIHGLDASHTHATIGKENGLAYIEGDARKMPFSDGSFDIVIAHRLFNSLGIITPGDALLLYAPTLANRLDPADENFQKDINKEVFRVLSGGGVFISQGDNIDPESALNIFPSLKQMTFPKTRYIDAPINIMQK